LGGTKELTCGCFPQPVVDSLGQEDSKVEIVTQVHFFHKLGYGLQLEVAPQVEVVPQPEVSPQTEVAPQLEVDLKQESEKPEVTEILVPPTGLEPLGP
jgi:hypothetical protein